MVSTRQMSTSLAAPNASPTHDEILYGLTTTTSTTASSTSQQNTARYTSVISSRHTNNQNVISGGGSIHTIQSSLSTPSSSSSLSVSNISLLDLPIEILDNIFSYVGYKKLGQLRVVSKQMNQIGGTILNSTFQRLQTQMLNRFQTVKAKMPRRESARRNHPLACECDIIETCHMRLSLLQMTFGKHIERKHCCFFPGGILDEVYNVLNYIRNTPKLERPYRVTDELFDLSTMAMEYFKEHIEPKLPEIAYFNKDFFGSSSKCKLSYSLKTVSDISESCSSSSSPPQSNMVLRKGIRKIKQGMKMYNNQLTVLRSELRNCKRKSSEQGKQIAEQQKLLADQQKQTLEYANRLDENDKKNEEMSRKFSTLLQELNKCKTELQYWRSKSPAIQVCTACGHKVAPVIAPDDFQALINQGVKPEDIINIDEVEDSDTSSNNALCDSDLETSTTSINSDKQNILFKGCKNSNDFIIPQNDEMKQANVFVSPDESTTAKLLAINTTMKNMKRNHNGIPTATATTTSQSQHNTVISSVGNPNSKGSSLKNAIFNYDESLFGLNNNGNGTSAQQSFNIINLHNQKHKMNNCTGFCSIEPIDNINFGSTASSSSLKQSSAITTIPSTQPKSLVTSTITKYEQSSSTGGSPSSSLSSISSCLEMNNKNILKSIPTINPSTFYPSSTSAFNDNNCTNTTNITCGGGGGTSFENSFGGNNSEQQQQTNLESAGQENKKRRVQKSGKRKI